MDAARKLTIAGKPLVTIGGHAVAASDSHRGESVRHFRDLIAQLFVGDADPRLGKDDRGALAGAALDQFQQGIGI